MKTKELYLIGGCSGVGKTTLVTSNLLYDKKRIHTGNIARRLSNRSLDGISKKIVDEIGKHGKAFLDTHYAAINIKTGYNVFYRGIEDGDLHRLKDIPKKIFVLIEVNAEEVLQRRLDDSRERSLGYKQIVEDIERNRENFFHYLKLTGARGYIIQNKNLDVARAELSEAFI